MSQQNLQLVQSIFAAWGRGDYSSASWADPEIEFVIADGPEPGRWKGLRAMAEAWRNVLTAMEEHRGEADEYRELDGERILVFTYRSARGKTSGVEFGQMRSKGAALFHLRNARVTRLVVYFDAERAVADLGSSSETA